MCKCGRKMLVDQPLPEINFCIHDCAFRILLRATPVMTGVLRVRNKLKRKQLRWCTIYVSTKMCKSPAWWQSGRVNFQFHIYAQIAPIVILQCTLLRTSRCDVQHRSWSNSRHCANEKAGSQQRSVFCILCCLQHQHTGHYWVARVKMQSYQAWILKFISGIGNDRLFISIHWTWQNISLITWQGQV